MVCPVCQTPIQEDMLFCSRCGTKIPRCPACGKVIERWTRFCTNDGTRLPEEILAVFDDDFQPPLMASTAGVPRPPAYPETQPTVPTAYPEEAAQCPEDLPETETIRTPVDDAETEWIRPSYSAPAGGSQFQRTTRPWQDSGAASSGMDNPAPYSQQSDSGPYNQMDFANPYNPQGYGPSGPYNSQGYGGNSGGNSTGRFCLNCGRPCPPDTDYCADCQDQILADEFKAALAEKQAARSRKPSVSLILLVLLLLLLLPSAALLLYLGVSSQRYQGGETREESSVSESEAGEADTQADAADAGSDTADSGSSTADSDSDTPSGTGTASRTGTASGAGTASGSGTTSGSDTPSVDEESEPVLTTTQRYDAFIDHCDSRVFQLSDLEGFTRNQYVYAINSIYAHAGRRFGDRDVELREFFSSKDWYHPTYDGTEFVERMLNGCEVQNLYLMLSYGVNQGFRSTSKADSQLAAFISGCDSLYFSASDLSELDEDMAYLARSAIYARSGWSFQSDYLRGYFSSYSWYHPSVSPSAFSDSRLNDYQRSNRNVVNRFIYDKGFTMVQDETYRYEY